MEHGSVACPARKRALPREAIARFEKAIALSTNDPQRWAFYTYGALALILKQDFERALEWTERASEIPNRQYWTLAHKAVALAYLGRGAEARRALDAAVAEQPNLGIGFARKKMYFLKRSDQLELYLRWNDTARSRPAPAQQAAARVANNSFPNSWNSGTPRFSAVPAIGFGVALRSKHRRPNMAIHFAVAHIFELQSDEIGQAPGN